MRPSFDPPADPSSAFHGAPKGFRSLSITPGQIIVRFVLGPSGKVRSLAFVRNSAWGYIQKGFTSESIRTARIPLLLAGLFQA